MIPSVSFLALLLLFNDIFFKFVTFFSEKLCDTQNFKSTISKKKSHHTGKVYFCVSGGGNKG